MTPTAPSLLQQATDTNSEFEWSPLDPESLVAAPCLIEQTLCQPSNDPVSPRLAKDVDYAVAVLDAWKEQEAAADAPWSTEFRRVVYESVEDDDDDSSTTGSTTTSLHGYLIRRQQQQQASPPDDTTTTTTATLDDKKLPASHPRVRTT
jgi:hypothetical protein